MRPIALAFVLVLAMGYAQAYPLNGGTEAVNCTLFGVTKVPILGQDPNATVQEYALKVDVGLIGTRNATFELVDSKDKAYSPDLSLTRALQPGRQLLAFVVPKDALFKLFKVSPSEGNPFVIKWWKTPKKVQGDIILRYYGVVDTRMDANEQSVAYEVGIQNNGTDQVYISPENFTLLDQWSWEYYTIDGFSPTYLGAKNSTKVKVNFSSLSPQSKPSALAYDYMTSNQIVVDLDKDTGPLSDAQVYGTNVPSVPSTVAPASPVYGTNVPSVPSTVAPAVVKAPTDLTSNPIAIDLKKDTSPFSGAQVFGTNGPSLPMSVALPAAVKAAPVQTVQAAPQTQSNSTGNATGKKSTAKEGIQSIKDQINATKERLANMGKPGTPGGNSSIGGQINSSVKDAIARLERMKEGLPNGEKSGQSTGVQPSSVVG